MKQRKHPKRTKRMTRMPIKLKRRTPTKRIRAKIRSLSSLLGISSRASSLTLRTIQDQKVG